MMPLVVVAIGSVAGAVAGGVAGWFVKSHRPEDEDGRRVVERPVSESDSAQIHDAAARWAQDNGIPEAADLAARKLRLSMHLADRRNGRRS
jgi:hypothetical protein